MYFSVGHYSAVFPYINSKTLYLYYYIIFFSFCIRLYFKLLILDDLLSYLINVCFVFKLRPARFWLPVRRPQLMPIS